MAVALLRWSLLPFVHRGELHDLPYLDRSGRSGTAAITNSPSRASTMPKHDSRSYGRNTGCHRADRPSSHGAAAHDEEIRSEEHTSELQSLMRQSYAGFCLKTTKYIKTLRTD